MGYDLAPTTAPPGKLAISKKHRFLLETLFQGRAEAKPFPNTLPATRQRIARQHVYGIRPDVTEAGLFQLFDLTDPTRVASKQTGRFIYVVREDDPQVVRVATLKRGVGHTSLSQNPEIASQQRYEPVAALVAGELELSEGRITDINLRSGHYKPHSLERIRKNLSPWVRRIVSFDADA